MENDSGKRRLLKALGVGAVGAAAVKTGVIPASWVKPVLDSVVMSAQAQPPMPSPSSSPVFAGPTAVPVSTSGLVALTAGILGYLGFKSLSRAKAHEPETRPTPPRD